MRHWTLTAILAALLALLGCQFTTTTEVDPGAVPDTDDQGRYLFCFWNVENLFDDRDDGRKTRGDDKYDPWFARDKAALATKLKHLSDVILAQNNGRGPDILCLAEVESERAAELLQQALNARLKPGVPAYSNLLFEPVSSGRHIAPAILTRLPVDSKRTELLARRNRVLRGQIVVDRKPLVVVASHWTSRVSDKTGKGRMKYAELIYGRFRAMYMANRKVDYILCGDFNDNPTDPSVVEGLRATGDVEAVRASGEVPKLLDLFAKAYENGAASHYYRNRGFLFDHICVSPGMLDKEGWSVEVDTAKVIKQMADSKGRPLRFGGQRDKTALEDRGAADHFPVSVWLRLTK